MCSSVLRAALKPIAEGPRWHFAKMTSAKEGVQMFIWDPCKHSVGIAGKGPVDAGAKEAIEAQWDVEARRLFEVRTAKWSADAREAFGIALGFIKI